ncbi:MULTISPECIES: fumarylacetoacetate hydrolase family protein [unclassified Marinobacter]|jgi:5-oxopent-3-ene-1,2,5-tricarboxylate decarboxylase/2-hydroxyhepta-2,4-diene-1,7-dioate isomerase|uniref:fumarylacetoacetate hydrolase family protein n=1 Tax=unclassified Marinobacter TaxID=83889 RepID=UPI00200FFC08|nr:MULTISPECIES: fumarylacetoacetate hydrolase family protein [unclassified Marinobacter]MCL1478411.1 fumarylacetoacetate hydrolase family protein [Marinobacter sp.]MCL1480367.1 fumarylacetoacetate hydrolase family protein [Marinobacter sp.]MCL1483765.1 fumarylacetoacetate hydrolase family protein [Marinobacter sp.]MCL1487385.1 fumarylacetoacetate hydrolase family protein [Marinobacter sp.]UQG55423.1 fumarylacetoacetate hydrolase family protein [Marinobacter sp. M4C]
MRHARIILDGRELDISIDANDKITTTGGEALDVALNSDKFTWLPPVKQPGTIFALGLNYADHATELAFEPPKEPLVFIKHANTLTGHKQISYRPDGIDYQHYECELVAVIGKTGKNIKREDALDYVAGYTVCNDFAIRDYLENYYRPNLRVKSRDSLLPMGPWIVDTADVPDANNLRLLTEVNGRITQDGSTKDMIFDIPFLIEYLSKIMTLNPGDMIATGTPHGVADMQPGDTVACSIENICSLETKIVSEQEYYGDNY